MTVLLNPFLFGGPIPAGQQLFTAAGAFVVPAGVTSICVVVIGRGGDAATDESTYSSSGGGGGLSYINNIAVTPGESLIIDTADGGTSGIRRVFTRLVSATNGNFNNPGGPGLGTGFSGGAGAVDGFANNLCGGGAAGYAGNGGNGFNGSSFGGGGTSVLGGLGGGAPAGNGVNLNGVNYGGGAGINGDGTIGVPGSAAIRIIWGNGRAYPNTSTGDVV